MPGYALSSFIFALVAAILGFGGIPGLGAWIAIGLFALLMALFVFSLFSPPHYLTRNRYKYPMSSTSSPYNLNRA